MCPNITAWGCNENDFNTSACSDACAEAVEAFEAQLATANATRTDAANCFMGYNWTSISNDTLAAAQAKVLAAVKLCAEEEEEVGAASGVAVSVSVLIGLAALL